MPRGSSTRRPPRSTRELRSLRERKNNIPARATRAARAALPRAAADRSDALPFAGELIAVRDGGSRLGRGRRAPAARLRAVRPGPRRALPRRVGLDQRPPPERPGRLLPGPARRGGRGLAARRGPRHAGGQAEVKDTPFAPWLERELARRADVGASRRWRSSAGCRAITKAGPGEGHGGRHEKDDRYRIDDRSQVRARLVQRAEDRRAAGPGHRAGRPAHVGRRRASRRHEKARDSRVRARPGAGRGWTQTHEFAEIDWQSMVNRIARLRAEHGRLKAASAALAELDARLDGSRSGSRTRTSSGRGWTDSSGGSISPSHDAEAMQREVRAVLAEHGCEPARAHFAAIADLLAQGGARAAGTAAACDRAETDAAHRDHALASQARRPARRGCAPRSSPRWASSAGSTRWRPASSTTRSSPPTATGSCTSGSPTTTCPGSSGSSRRT